MHEGAPTFLREALVVRVRVLLVAALSQVMQLPLLIGQFLLLHSQVFLQAAQLRLQTVVVRLEVGKSPVFGLKQNTGGQETELDPTGQTIVRLGIRIMKNAFSL